MPVSICAVTSTRADYGILSPLLRALSRDPFFALTLVATGTHLLPEYGHTLDEIAADGFSPLPVSIMGGPVEGAVGVGDVMAEALRQFSRLFAKHSFDLLLALGDRYEMAAVCCAAVNARLPIAHLHGGETTEGAIDECYRHAITKMSVLHFPACEVYRRRIIQLGETPDRVYNVGALAVENILRTPPYPLEALAGELQLPLAEKPYAVVTFHPVTQEGGTAAAQLRELTAAMEERSDLCYLITKANADEGGALINEAWDSFAAAHANCRAVASLGMRRYLTALRHSRMALGNSSSGIIEAPVCRVPTVNIGDRQKGRLRTASIIDCAPQREAILRAMRQAEEPAFREAVRRLPCPYGEGDTSAQIVGILRQRLQTPLSVQKTFYDIQECDPHA